MKKYIANIITGGRVVFSLPLLFISLSSVWFYILYLFCGLTDMIDGMIARKTGTVSKFGARLDTVADFVFMLVCSIKILPLMHVPVYLWIWIIMIALIKIFNIALVLIRKKKVIHEYTYIPTRYILAGSITVIEILAILALMTALCINIPLFYSLSQPK